MNTEVNDKNIVAVRPQPRRLRNPLTLLLLWASKTDTRLVAVCSRWTVATQVAFGALVLFTTLLALCSSYYTLSTLNVSGRFVPWIAAAYASFIFVTDREIVGGLDKATAFVRPVLALVIGIVVAVPVEMWVFQERVDQELTKQYRQNNREQIDEFRNGKAHLEKRRADLQENLTELRRQESNWARVMDNELVGRSDPGRTGAAGAGPVFENAKLQQEAVRAQIKEVRKDLDQLEKSLPQEQKQLEREFQKQEVPTVTSFVTRYEALEDVIHSSGALYRLSWGITLFLICLEMSGAVMKLLTPHVDYHHLVNTEIEENVLRINEIAYQNYEDAKKDPDKPRPSVAEKFAQARFTPSQEEKPSPFRRASNG